MDSSNTVEVISSSISTQHNQYTLPSLQPSDAQMADYLACHEPPPSPPHDTLDNHILPPVHPMNEALDDDTTLTTLMWVPADRHPEIAPGEFTKWLDTNGTNTRKSSLRRKSSALSPIHTADTQGFDRHSPTQDTSRVLTKGTPSLLRRKAFSARGRERQPLTSRHGQHPIQSSKTPVRLYDRPVSMNEWVDLGSASLSQDILSRVHDAESHFLSRPKTNNIHKLERKSSWFGGFFDKEKKRGSRVEDEHYAHKKQPKKKSFGLPHLLKLQMAPLLLSKPSFSKTLRPPSPPLEEKQQPMVYHSYRLPIHVERAIYRLSHYKLADPRRPLQHQVVISNLMFWYLSQQHPSPTLINNKSTNTILASGNTNKSLHAHFDDRTKNVHKGYKSGRIGIPKPRPYKVTPIDQRRKMDTNDTKDDDDDGDDDLPLSYYKQTS